MADTKITQLQPPQLGYPVVPATDVLPIVVIADPGMATSGSTRKVTVNQLLGSGGTATLASATITGDLTVDTNVLKVDTTLNRVSINTTTFATDSAFAVKTTAGKFDVRAAGSLSVKLNSDQSMLYNVPTGNSHLFQINDSDAMTLNSTGLGVGISPSYKLNIGAANPTGGNIAQFYNNATSSLNGAFCLITQFGVQDWYMGQPAGVSAFTIGTGTTSKSEFFRIDGSGNVGIGVTPSAGSTFKVIQGGAGIVFGSQGAQSNFTENAYLAGAGTWTYATNAAASLYQQSGGTHTWYRASASTGTIAWTQAMTLDASGNLLVGTTGTVVSSDSRFRVSATAVPAVDAKTTAATQAVVDEWNSDTSGDNLFNRFWTESSPIAFRGSISYNRAGGLVAYNTTSDYRAKDIIGPVSNSGSLIDSLKVYVGKMKGATIERPMLIAHELQEVAPYAVSGEKDAVDADGKPKYQQMDASALVPLLIAEIKSLRARVQTLETR